jgi:integrase/recombinase XerD
MYGDFFMRKNEITMKRNTGNSIERCFDAYVKKCEIDNLSKYTISASKTAYRVFSFYVDTNMPMDSIKEDTIDGFILFLKHRESCNDNSINSYLRMIRVWLYWAMEKGYMDKFKINLIRTSETIKETYTKDELDKLLKKPDIRNCTFTEYKTWVFTNFLLGTGMRISSALSVKIEDVDFGGMMIIMNRSKNRRAQTIPMSKTLSQVLKEYLDFRQGEPDDFLFCNVTGGPGNVKSFQDNLSYYNNSRGVSKKSAHLYRHTFAKNWILNGGDIFRLKAILGHSSLDMVNQYVKMFSNDVAVDFDKFNPLDNLVKSDKFIRMKKND